MTSKSELERIRKKYDKKMSALEKKHDREINHLWTMKGKELTRAVHKGKR